MAERDSRPAFYAAAPGGWRDWWTLLHSPYTAWHLAYVVIGASLAPHTDTVRLLATVLAFFCAVGVSAHALDEVHDRPLRTAIPDAALWLAAGAGLLGAVALGLLGLSRVGPWLVLFMVIGPVLVLGYNLELFGGRLHTDVAFALGWGAFPILTGYFAQAERLGIVALLAGAAGFALSYAQRSLSTPARLLRRCVTQVDGALAMKDGTIRELHARVLLEPLEQALGALSWSMVALATALAVARIR
jgi:hypothetical protein